jgi:hypothetical protein
MIFPKERSRRQSLKKVAKMMIGQPDTWRRIARACLKMGLIGLVILTVFAIAVFGFGIPVHNKYSGRLMSREEVVPIFFFLILVSAFFAAIGWLVLSRLKSKP